MTSKLILPLAALALLLWVAGCSESPSDSTNLSEEISLEDEFGGYLATPESPGFGDAELLGEDDGNVEYDDQILLSPECDSIVRDPNAGLFHFRAVWGRLDFDPDVTEQTDWSGALTVSRGVEVIRRVIRFELGQDYILERTSRDLIEWHSKTTVHNDGIAVDIFVPRPQPVFDTTLIIDDDGLGNVDTTVIVDTLIPELEPVTVTFETGPYSRTFLLEDLVKLDTVVHLDDGNAVAFQAFQLYRMPCPRGFLAGRWGFDEEGQGVFRGVWMTHNGRISGYVKGHFGKNDDGKKVFFGKWISRNGQVEGFLKGHYGSRPHLTNSHCYGWRSGGWMAGRIYDANRVEIGVLKGIWAASPPHARDHFFQARWRLHCGPPPPGEITGWDDGLEDEEIDYGGE